MKKLSIIIVNYNSSAFLINCLKSLSESGKIASKKEKWEAIIVDNGSSEDLNALKKYLKTCPLENSLLINQENLGFGAASNIGVKKAKGDYILFLNPDTIISLEALDFVLKYLRNHKDVGIATCSVNLENGILDDASHRGFPTPWNGLCYFSGMASFFPKSLLFNGYHLGYQKMDKIHEIDACCGAFMMVQKICGDEIGWFDEDYFWYGEDLDFCYRAKQKRWKVVFIPNVSIAHIKGIASGIKKHSSKISKADINIKKTAQKARFNAMRIFYKKNYKDKYPPIIQSLVLTGIDLKELLTSL